MNFWVLAGIIGAVLWIGSRKRNALEQHLKEQRELNAQGNVATGAEIVATPPISTYGELPLTSWNAAVTVPKLEQRGTTQYFPRAGNQIYCVTWPCP